MTASTTSTVYINVIEDVINKVRDEFIHNDGPGETVLSELQAIWEMKMIQAGAVLGPIERSLAPKQAYGGPIIPVHDLNVPYEGTGEYETPTAELLFPPTPLQTPIQTPVSGIAQTPLPDSTENLIYNIPSSHGTDNHIPGSDTGCTSQMINGRHASFLQPPSWLNQRPPLRVDVNVAYDEQRDDLERKNSHQPLTQDFFMLASGKRKREDIAAHGNSNNFIPQRDGTGDSRFEDEEGRCCTKMAQVDGPASEPYDDVLSAPNLYNYQGILGEDYSLVSVPTPLNIQSSSTVTAPQNDAEAHDDEALNEDDDEDDLDDLDEGEELNTQNLVLAQFEKVTRTKSRWKCTLRDGIMHINDKDVLFNKATGEFDF